MSIDQSTLRDILVLLTEVFTRLGVPYYVGGSAASSIHGKPRMTADTDLVADLRPSHLAGFVAALEPRFYLSADAIRDAIGRRGSFNIIDMETAVKVNVFVLKPRLFDQQAMGRRVAMPIARERPDEKFPFASPEDTILAKLESYRLGNEVSERQWHDILGVLKMQEGRLDESHLDRWAAELGVSDLLTRARREYQQWWQQSGGRG